MSCRTILTLAALMAASLWAKSQNYVKLAAATDFKKTTVFQTFAFDLNRTEKADEKTGSNYFFYNDNGYYILPSIDINLGEGTTISENNILTQVLLGKVWNGRIRANAPLSLSRFQWNQFLEFSPSFNADKQFVEKLGFMQIKNGHELLRSRHNIAGQGSFVQNQQAIILGPVVNFGGRYSKAYSKSSLYFTAGMFLDLKWIVSESASTDNIIFKITGSYCYIGSDVEELTSDKFVGIIKPSAEFRLISQLWLAVSYKYGNDTPGYNYVNSAELALKYKY